jgi:hypothetical protein
LLKQKIKEPYRIEAKRIEEAAVSRAREFKKIGRAFLAWKQSCVELEIE